MNGSHRRPIGKGRYSYQTPASLVGMVYRVCTTLCSVLLHIYLFITSRSTSAHQDLLLLIKIFLCPPRSAYAHQDLPLPKIYFRSSKSTSVPQNCFCSSKSVPVHQHLLLLLNSRSCSPKSTSVPQDLFLFLKIYFYPSRSVPYIKIYICPATHA